LPQKTEKSPTFGTSLIHIMKTNHRYLFQIIALLKKLGIVLLLFSISRFIFYVFNSSYFAGSTGWEIIKVFFFGIRFDYAAIIQYNLLFIVLYLLPFAFSQTKIYQRSLLIAFWFINGLLLLSNFVDIEYFKYSSKRSNFSIFKFISMSDDVATLLPQFFRDFWYILVLWAVVVFSGVRLTYKLNLSKYDFTIKNYLLNGLIMVLMTGLLFMTARGFAMKPIRVISAARYTKSQNIPLLLNTPFTILHTIKERELTKREYFSPDTCKKIFSPIRQYPKSSETRENVMIIILESFSHEFIGALSGKKTYTPFLDSLLNESLLFENGFANCRQSIEGIPAVLASLPSITDNTYISSHFAGNRLIALPGILQNHGYSTAFFHGGRNGTMGFDEFSKVAGIKNYFGMNEYNGPEASDGSWGVFDEEFLQYVALKNNDLKTPFLSTVFTLSSHHPYKVPSKYDKIIPANEEPQLRSIRYSDYALREFFKLARQQNWFNNTLFVIVADHTAKVIDQEYNNPVGMYRIPIAFYHPENDTLKGRRQDIAQQTDIMPSLIQYLGIKDTFLAYGNSVFALNREPYSISYLGGIYYFFKDSYLLSFDGDKCLGLFKYPIDKQLKNNLLEFEPVIMNKLERQLKAIIQDYQTRLEGNKLFY